MATRSATTTIRIASVRWTARSPSRSAAAGASTSTGPWVWSSPSGIGAVTAEAHNQTSDYQITASGWVFPLGIGVEWQVAEVFKLGPQFLAYLHVSTEICEDPPPLGQDGECRKPAKNEQGDREGLALPWRLVLTGTFTFGRR
jgi:hypothetical protein